MKLIFALILGIFAAWYLLSPLKKTKKIIKKTDFGKEELGEKKRSILQSLADLELDYRENKLTSEDYEELALAYKQELAVILKELDKSY